MDEREELHLFSVWYSWGFPLTCGQAFAPPLRPRKPVYELRGCVRSRKSSTEGVVNADACIHYVCLRAVDIRYIGRVSAALELF